MKYVTRWKSKYIRSYNQKFLKRCALLIKYIIIDLTNIILLTSTKTQSNINLSNCRNILFIEPKKQGYGDLLFQTPIFEYIGSRCNLDIICQAKHECILESNPFVKNTLSENNEVNFKNYDCVFYLSRSTVGENLLALKCNKASKIPLDKNLTKWAYVFDNYSHTKAWQKLFDNIFNSSNVYFLPKLYIKNTPKKENLIILVAGTENIEKGIQNIDETIEYLHKTLENTIYKLEVVGKTDQNINIPYDKKIINSINKTPYRECIDHISSAKLVIGPEGSLIHMSTTLGIPTIVGQYGRDFNKYSEIRNKNIFITEKISVPFLEKSLTEILESLSD